MGRRRRKSEGKRNRRSSGSSGKPLPDQDQDQSKEQTSKTKQDKTKKTEQKQKRPPTDTDSGSYIREVIKALERETGFEELDKKMAEALAKGDIFTFHTLGDKHRELEQKYPERLEKIRGLFHISPDKGVQITHEIDRHSRLYRERWSRFIEPQIKFLQNIVNFSAGSTPAENVKIKISPIVGNTWSHTDVGNKGIFISTQHFTSGTPIHELVHQLDEQLGLYEKRQKPLLNLIEKKTGKKYTEIPLKNHPTISSVKIPSGILTPEQEREYGYMFRVYPHQMQNINGVFYIREKPEKWWWARDTYLDKDIYGTELLTEAARHIYENPSKFASDLPEVFDIAVNVFRGIQL